MTGDRAFVDSNVWVYLFTSEDSPKCKVAERFLAAAEGTLVISYQVVNEVANVLLKKGFDEHRVRFVMESMSKICIVQDYSGDIVLLASTLREKHHFSFWDSLIVASAQASQCRYLVSEDMQDNQVVGGVTIKNIFKV